jgi:hypothetical protein
VSAWLESFFWSTSELLLDIVVDDGGTTCLARDGTDGRDGLAAGWPRLAGGRTREVVMPSLDRYEAFVLAVLGNRASPFMAVAGLQRSFTQSGIWCRQHGARQWSACEVSLL